MQLVCNLIVLCLSLATYIIVAEIEAPTLYTSLSVDQMVDDWQVVPFVDVVAGDNYGNCPDMYEPMFTNLWQGTVKGVEIQQTSSSQAEEKIQQMAKEVEQ